MGDSTDRAERLVASARTETVTTRLLVGGDEYTGEFFLYGDPPITRLEDGEQPHATLFNDMKGVGIGSKRDTVTPDGGARSVFVVTDERLLLLVGKQDGDWERAVPLADVTGAAYHTGFMKHRVVVDTIDSRYHLWVDASYEERDLAATVELLTAAVDRATEGDPARTGAPGTATPRSDTSTGTDATADAGDRSDAGTIGGAGAVDADESDAGTVEADGSGSGSADGDGSGSGGPDGDGSESNGSADGPDPLDQLERLKELHDQDVLTDEEFERKKADLLDQI
ncbi:SHOCT domain-containing protein [Halorubellus salinus]|uniref:SHOCT domain-containing protein n=1 Tax=Halorubellus salinus TaxID=755309 RepID=UPI001D086173|nr:SHOCT domain-containing protein [Halorubellus salinus]